MGLIAQIKADIEQITSNSNEFGVELTLVAPEGQTATVTGLHTKHNINFDTEGNKINSLNAHASFSEKFLIDADYPVRNSEGEVDLKRHRLSAKDSTGIVKHYIINESWPDETLGLIVCILDTVAL